MQCLNVVVIVISVVELNINLEFGVFEVLCVLLKKNNYFKHNWALKTVFSPLYNRETNELYKREQCNGMQHAELFMYYEGCAEHFNYGL